MSFNVGKLIGKRLKRLHELLVIHHTGRGGVAPDDAAKRASADIEKFLGHAFDHLARHYDATKTGAVHAVVRLQGEILDFFQHALTLKGKIDIGRLERLLADMDAEMAKLSQPADKLAASIPKPDLALPPRVRVERPIPPGGISVEARMAQGGGEQPRPDVLKDPKRYYYADGQYHRRPSPEPDFSSDGPPPVPTGTVKRPIPDGGISIDDAIKAGKQVSPKAREFPDDYYFDGKRSVKRPTPTPDFTDGAQRDIPCFPADTLVRVGDGWRPITELAAGELLISADESARRPEPRPIVEVRRGAAIRLVRIRLAGEELAATREHRFLVAGAGWLAARSLRAGDPLVTEAGPPAVVLRAATVEVAECATVNLEVAEHHTYFVGRTAVMVHNDNDARVWRIYVGTASDGSLYVGRTQEDIFKREAGHHKDARVEPKKYGFKKDMKLEQIPGMDGLTYDQSLWHERRVFDYYKKLYGDRVKNIESPPTGDDRIFELKQKYC